MADIYKKEVLRVESRSKNGKSWKAIIMKGKEAGTEVTYHIFDKAMAAKFSGPGTYMVKLRKNEKDYWEISEVVKGPFGGEAQTAPAGTVAVMPVDITLLMGALNAAGRIFSGAGDKSLSGKESVDLETRVVTTMKTLYAESKALLNQKTEPRREPANDVSSDDAPGDAE